MVSIDSVATSHFYADMFTNTHGVGGGSTWGGGHGYGATATDGLLVTVEKLLPAELVDKICDARSRITTVLHEVESEPIEEKEEVKLLKNRKFWVFRGVEYPDFASAVAARENAAYQAHADISNETGFVDLLATPPVEVAEPA